MSSTENDQGRHEILAVDDSADSLRILTDILAVKGYRIRIAPGGLPALQSVARKPPDIILLDVKMPDMDGFEVCRRLKSDERSRRIPIIFISAMDEPTDRLRGFEAGGVDFIAKPFDASEVLARLEIHLRMHDLTEHLEQQVGIRTAEWHELNQRLQAELAEREQADKALTEQRQLLEIFFENSMTANVILDREFNFIRVNEEYAAADDRKPEDFPGHNHFEFYPSDAKTIFEEVVSTGKPFQATARPFVFTNRPERGMTYWDWTLAPVKDDAGEVKLLIFVLKEITKQQKAMNALIESEARLREAQQIAKLGNWELDLGNDKLWWSDETFRIFQIDPQESGLAFEAFLNAIHPDDRERVADYIKDAVQNKAAFWQIDYRIALPGGEDRFIHEEAKAIFDDNGKILRRIGTVQDVTERTLREEEISKLNAELEQRVKERTAELAAKNAQLEKMNQLFVGREMQMIKLKERIRELEIRTGEKEEEEE